MEQTSEMTTTIEEWQDALNNLVEISYQTAQLSANEFAGSELERDVDRLVDDVIASNERLIDHLSEPLESGEDLDAQDRLFGLIYGSLVGVDALNSSGEEPQLIAATLRIETVDSYPSSSWRQEIEEATAIVSSRRAVTGAAIAPDPLDLDDTIEHLSTTAGTELRSTATDTVVTLVIPQLPGALAAVIGGHGGDLIKSAAHYISGAFARVKKAASRIVQWVVDRAHRILPPRLRAIVSGFVATNVDMIKEKADQLIGSIAAMALGRGRVEAAWNAASPATIASARPRMASATDDPLKRIGQVTRCRSFIDKWLKSLIALLAKVPAVTIGIAAAAAAVIALVLYELWRGLHQLGALVLPQFSI